MNKSFNLIIHYSLLIIIFLFPLFFLPFTQEFFSTGKLYLLAFGCLLLFLISTLQFLISKKLSWQSLPFDTPLVLFLITIGLSIILSSPNKIQALLNPNFGLVSILSLTILYFYLSRHKNSLLIIHYSLSISSIILSLIAIIFFFQPLKNTNLPQSLQFLKNPSFTPIGNQIDLAFFLGFFIALGLAQILKQSISSEQSDNEITKKSIINYSLLTINLIALSLTLYSLFKPQVNNQSPATNLQLPPFYLSWYAAVEVLKNPLTAAFGVGVDNFSSIFTRVKDLAYNQSNLWQINSFVISRSTILHIFSETGLFALLAFGLLLLSITKIVLDKNTPLENKTLSFYLLLILFFFPPSLPVFFLFFVNLAKLTSESVRFELAKMSSTELSKSKERSIDFSDFPPVYFGLTIVSLVVIGACGYFLGRAYASEIYFKKSLDGFAKNDAKQVYENMRQAIILNPYIERFRLNFSQVNLLIANNISAKAGQPQGKDQKPYQLTEQDRQNISQAIQAAINEAKAAITLNPQKASHWENLATIYRNILNLAQGADVWTISAYQRAIVADPQNPIYRLNLGGVYYSLGNYDEAVKLFEQAVALKPDWPNAHYNLAWADYQKQNYQRAVSEMQNVLTLLNPQKDKADYEKAQKELEEFKKKLPEEEAKATASAQPSQLTLPTPPTATMEPKIQLPKEASPEAK